MKKKAIAITATLIAIIALLATGCSGGVSESDYNQVVSERDQARTQVTSLQGELAIAEEEVATLEEQVVTLEEQVTSLEDDLSAAVSERDQAKDQAAGLQDELTTAEERIAALEEGTLVPELEEQVASLESDLAAAREQIAALEEQKTTLEGEITAVEEKVTAAANYADLLSWHVTPQEEPDLTGLVEEWQTRLQEIDDAELSAIIGELGTFIESQQSEELTDEEISESAEYQDIHERISNHLIQKVAGILAAQ